MIVAARTDPELQVVVHGVAARLEQTVIDILRQFFPDIEDLEVARTIVNLAFTIVQGAAVSGYAGFGDPAQTINQLRLLASLVTPSTARVLAEATNPRLRAGDPAPDSSQSNLIHATDGETK